jgi:hypothetical protein
MRAPWTPVFLIAAAVGLAVAGCASQPKEDEASRTANKPACTDDAANPLHLTTLRKEVPRDPELESLLNQSNDPRLARINREMYQTLRTLDAELHRRQQVAACERGDSDVHALQVKSTQDAGSGNGVGTTGSAAGGLAAVSAANSTGAGGSGAAGGTNPAGAGGAVAGGLNAAGSAGGGASGGTRTGGGTATSAPMPSSAVVSSDAATARTSLIRKSSVAPTTLGGGGNGATAQKVSGGSDNDIVARRLRKAAEQETDPALKAKLWKEYAQYQQGNSAK